MWDCEAYGPEGIRIGAMCFFGPEMGERECASVQICHLRMIVERQRIYERIQEMAAEGDPVGEYLAGEFTSPEQILGGAEESAEEEE